jgi:quinol monooxygenase YgiN
MNDLFPLRLDKIPFEASSMILSTIRMKIAQEKHDDVLNILGSIAERTKNETGCSSCTVSLDAKDDSTIVFEELWKSEDHMQNHLRSDDYKHILLIMEMSLEPPEVKFNTISRITGVETIRKARRFFKEHGRMWLKKK